MIMKNSIKKRREELGMSLTELAIKSDLSAGYICHLENGSRKNPSMKVVQQIAKALNTTVDALTTSI